MGQFIRIKGWAKYQHYKKRNPPWIKLHREILTSLTWTMADDASRVLAIAIMLLAAANNNKIPYDGAYIKRVSYLNSDPDIDALVRLDFIEIIDDNSEIMVTASTPLADASKMQAHARPEAETEQSNKPPTPLGPSALASQEKPENQEVLDIDPWQAGQVVSELLGLGGQQKALARDACAAVKRRKPDMRFTEIPEWIVKLWREYDSMAVHAKVSLKTFLGEIGRFMDSDSWRGGSARASPQVDENGGHYEWNGPQKIYVTADGKRLPGYTPPPKAKEGSL